MCWWRFCNIEKVLMNRISALPNWWRNALIIQSPSHQNWKQNNFSGEEEPIDLCEVGLHPQRWKIDIFVKKNYWSGRSHLQSCSINTKGVAAKLWNLRQFGRWHPILEIKTRSLLCLKILKDAVKRWVNRTPRTQRSFFGVMAKYNGKHFEKKSFWKAMHLSSFLKLILAWNLRIVFLT